MAIVPMQKVAVLSLLSQRDAILGFLQGKGVIDVSVTDSARTDHTEVQFRRAELDFAIDVLQNVASKDILAAAGTKMTPEEIRHGALQADVSGIVEKLHTLEEEETTAQRELSQLQERIDRLSPWAALPLNLSRERSTDTTTLIFGTVPSHALDDLQIVLRKKAPRSILESWSVHDTVAYCSAVVWKEDRSAFEEAVTGAGWSSTDLPVLEGTAHDIVQNATQEIAALTAQHDKRQKQYKELSAYLPVLVQARTYVGWLDEKQAVRETLSETEQTCTLHGWIRRDTVDQLEQELKEFSKATALIAVEPDEGEEAPVLLKNAKFITPFESVTSLYGLPLGHEMDPTSALSPFFILYFALCLTDAGYGIVLAVLFGIYLWKSKQSIQQAPLWWLMFFCGIVTTVVSIPFGGYFGLTPEQVPEALTYLTDDGKRMFLGQIWNLGTQDGINFLQYLSLLLGITHLFFGMFLAGWHKWVHGKKSEAFWQDFTSHLLLGGILFRALAPAEATEIATYLLWATVALAIWGKGYGNPWYLRPVMGILGMVNFGIGLLSNGLSYLRILALGLVTGALAAAVNQVAIELGKLFPIFIAIPVMVLIFLGGHLVSIALNALGSFIHSGRLQFIEFFSQFFEGGGKPYSPFKYSS